MVSSGTKTRFLKVAVNLAIKQAFVSAGYASGGCIMDC